MSCRVLYLLFFLLLSVQDLCAKEKYYTRKDIWCTKGECVLRGTTQPFSGEVRYFFSDDKIFRVINYKNGKKNGKSIEYYKGGGIKSMELYNKGELNGVAREFYENGNYKKEVYYKEGKKDGQYKEFYENGKPKVIKTYDNDLEDGRVKMFYENGKLYIDLRYDEGNLVNFYCLSPKGKRYNMNNQKNEFLIYGHGVCDNLFKQF